MPVLQDPITVELVPHRGWDDKAVIPGWVDHDQYMVMVHSRGLAYRNPDCKLQVGWISKRAGARFCPTNEFNGFIYAHQKFIDEEARRLHGNASDKPCDELPPHIEPGVGYPIED